MKKMIIKQDKNRGFSLIELLLVLVILAALTAIVAPKFTNRSKQARVTASQTDISNIELALDSYEIDTGELPTSSEGLEVLVEEPSDVQNWQGPYIKRGVPKDPWGNEYVYVYPGRENENGYDLYSTGPDGKDGTDDDVVNWHEDE
ncbi:type II secretion system major pseudopilin GspG [Poriferisphaera sp. WC338]|uniref:type II secretion system major pseudopilin GspG n=1 Tax=Poriferisphaera sp. WC338 TaxID=3425129 RepID=UPI003D8137D9